MMIFFDSIRHRNWVSEDCINSHSNGFDYIWKTPRAFLSEYVERLKNQLIQMWRTRCKNNVKLSYYFHNKTDIQVEPYITSININEFRKQFG